MGKNDNAHFIVNFYLLFHSLVLDYNIEIAIVFGVGRTGERASNPLMFGNGQGCWGVEDCLSEGPFLVVGEGKDVRRTYFQWVYCACGPVENWTFLCVHSKDMSNHARNACTSKIVTIFNTETR